MGTGSESSRCLLSCPLSGTVSLEALLAPCRNSSGRRLTHPVAAEPGLASRLPLPGRGSGSRVPKLQLGRPPVARPGAEHHIAGAARLAASRSESSDSSGLDGIERFGHGAHRARVTSGHRYSRPTSNTSRRRGMTTSTRTGDTDSEFTAGPARSDYDPSKCELSGYAGCWFLSVYYPNADLCTTRPEVAISHLGSSLRNSP